MRRHITTCQNVQVLKCSRKERMQLWKRLNHGWQVCFPALHARPTIKLQNSLQLLLRALLKPLPKTILEPIDVAMPVINRVGFGLKFSLRYPEFVLRWDLSMVETDTRIVFKYGSPRVTVGLFLPSALTEAEMPQRF